MDIRGAAGDIAAARKHAAELVALGPDIILAIGNVTMPPLLEATRTIPIVFAVVVDPVGTGYVKSLSKPGGNVTGFMMFEYSLSGKWPELLKQIARTSRGRRSFASPHLLVVSGSSPLFRPWLRR